MLEESIAQLLPFIKMLMATYAASICVTSLVALGAFLVILQALTKRF